ncbi:hypothetical protein [uncultured Selenomonas sp.]|uniref:hypothetical protein n=1 Tax=uncultured Selenomonas sp. TaxID=159275 RepID=UPI0028DBD418|nr:hypothetical protein [uncultured Selenomonas sp.]
MSNELLFPQFLLNRGVLNAEEVAIYLKRTLAVKVDVPVQAIFHGVATAKELTSLGDLSGEEFRVSAEKKGILTASQLRNLGEAIAGEGCRFAQALLDAGRLDYGEIERLFREFVHAGGNPLAEAIECAAAGRLMEELPLYTEYVGVALQSFKRFMKIGCVIVPQAEPFPAGTPRHIVSQAVTGGASLVAGIEAADDVFLDLARRYSREDFETLDDLAVDSLAEFLNVLDGFFAVRLGERGLELDLETPKMACALSEKAAPSKLLRLPVESPVGAFALFLAADEFL